MEIPTDHALMATLYRTAAEVGTRYLLTGSNFATEGIMPNSWAYNPKDLRHLKSIHRQFGDGRFDSFPRLGYVRDISYTYIRRIQRIRLLHHMPYVKADALQTLEQELGRVYYGGKHYESVFTRFFQAYILPRKFGIDKRRAHLWTLICSGQLSRDQALTEASRRRCTTPSNCARIASTSSRSSASARTSSSGSCWSSHAVRRSTATPRGSIGLAYNVYGRVRR